MVSPLASLQQHPSVNRLTQRQSDGTFNSVFDPACDRNFLDSDSETLACIRFSANEVRSDDHGMKSAMSKNQIVPRSDGLETDKNSNNNDQAKENKE